MANRERDERAVILQHQRGLRRSREVTPGKIAVIAIPMPKAMLDDTVTGAWDAQRSRFVHPFAHWRSVDLDGEPGSGIDRHVLGLWQFDGSVQDIWRLPNCARGMR